MGLCPQIKDPSAQENVSFTPSKSIHQITKPPSRPSQRPFKMFFAPISTQSMIVVYLAAVAAAQIDNSQVFNIGGGTTPTLTSSRTTFPTASNSANSLEQSTTTSPPGSANFDQGGQQIQQGPDGVKTVINGDQTIIDGPSGRTVINGGQTIVQSKATNGGQINTRTREGSTGGAALATGIPLVGAMMVAGGAMALC
jgi:hypothetical protein